MANDPPTSILKKIQDLEAGHALLKHEMSKLMAVDGVERNQQEEGRSLSVSPQRQKTGDFEAKKGPVSRLQRGNCGGGGGRLSEKFYKSILQSMGQSVHVFDLDGRITYWNRSAEHLFGYPASEALGLNAIELLVDAHDFDVASNIIHRVTKGESWKGKFPVKNKLGERFLAIATNTPFYDDDGSLVGVICVSCDSRYFQDIANTQYATRPNRSRISYANKHGFESQPLQVAIASKITDLASKVTDKVRSRIKRRECSMEKEIGAVDYHSDREAIISDHREDGASSGASTPRGDIPHGAFATSGTEDKSPRKANKFSVEESEGKSGIHKILSSKAEALFAKKGISWPWKGHEPEGTDSKSRFIWPWLHGDTDNDSQSLENSEIPKKIESQAIESNRNVNNGASGSWSSVNVNSTSSISSGGSTGSSAMHKVDMQTDCLDYEIVWEDLIIGEQIGQGSCGTVYHALWYGSDVAVKVFSNLEYTDEVIFSFRQEVSLMKRLRHPNILLFMGAITSPQRLCIVTEFLPRGSLLQLLQKHANKIDWRRRIHMAIDVARGMNYLHHCNPPIIHRDLKSSNLLVDRNWTVKVADFGLSRLKREAYLTTRTGKGTPQWMAPEVLRNEPSDEKSDVYSYGVILWELVTEKIPWDNLNAMQVIGAVGFMDRRLELPIDLDPQWASIIESCWHSDPQSRPTFVEILERFKELHRQYLIQTQMQRATSSETAKAKLNAPD